MTSFMTRGGPRILEVLLPLLLVSGLLAATGCGGGSLTPGQNGHKTLTSLIISPVNPVVIIGDSERFVVTGIYSDNSKQDVTRSVTWNIDDSTIATIDASGMATAKQAGVAKITATSGSLSASIKLTVADATLISILVTPSGSSVPKGGMEQLTATGTFTDGTTKDMTSAVIWASSAPAIAAVSSTGLVSGVGTGSATITASSNLIRGAETVIIAQPALVSLTIAPSGYSLAKGRSQQLAVTGTFGDGSTADLTASVAWTVSPASVASVSTTGLATALATGTARITAISGSISASTNFTVSPATLVSLAVTPSNPSVAKGSTQQLAVTGTFTDGSAQNMTGTVAWTTSSSNTIAVSNLGMVTALENGTATVTATSGSVSGSDMITVTAASLLSIAISPVSPSIMNGKTQQLTATGKFGDGTTQDISNKVSWGGAVPGVADLSSTGLLTARGAGIANITATSGSIIGSDTITVLAITLTSIAITPANVSVPKGETEQLAATGSYSDGSTQDLTGKVVWSGGLPGAVDLSASGLITATNLGTATITATDGSISGTTSATVSAAVPVSLAVSPTAPSISVGSIQQFLAVETLSDGTQRPATSLVKWTSANPDIASISAAGLATAKAEGTATINANYRSVTGSGTLTVIPVIYDVTETKKAGTFTHTYFDKTNVSGADANIRITDSGPDENICAMVYVFTADQEMSECCGCKVSEDGLLTLSLNNDLTSNPITGTVPARGTVEIIASDATSNPTCNPATLTPKGVVTVWTTHIQPITQGELPQAQSSPSTTPSQNGFASPQTLCQFVQELGSGQGICTCGTGD